MTRKRKEKAQAAKLRKAIREGIEDRPMDEVMAWFANHLTSYFGDDDDASAVRQVREDCKSHPYVGANFRHGLDCALNVPAWNRVKLVRDFANRHVTTDEEARAWLLALQAKLFAG